LSLVSLVMITNIFADNSSEEAASEAMVSSLVTTAIISVGSEEDFEYETSSIQYPGRLKQVPVTEAVVKIVLYVVAIVLGLIGNLVVILTVCCRRSMHTTTNYYLVNLAVSDLAVTLSCSWVHLVADLTEGWVLGWFFCKANSFIQGWNNVDSTPPACQVVDDIVSSNTHLLLFALISIVSIFILFDLQMTMNRAIY